MEVTSFPLSVFPEVWFLLVLQLSFRLLFLFLISHIPLLIFHTLLLTYHTSLCMLFYIPHICRSTYHRTSLQCISHNTSYLCSTIPCIFLCILSLLYPRTLCSAFLSHACPPLWEQLSLFFQLFSQLSSPVQIQPAKREKRKQGKQPTSASSYNTPLCLKFG